MGYTVYMRKGDRRPYLSVTIKDRDTDTVVNLTGLTVKFYMVTADTTRTIKVNGTSCTVTDATNGVVEYRWAANDTNTVQQYYGWFQITYGDSTLASVPPDDSLIIDISNTGTSS